MLLHIHLLLFNLAEPTPKTAIRPGQDYASYTGG